MELPKKFLHDRVILILVTAMAVLLAIGVTTVLIRFDISKNPTTTIAYRPSISGTVYQNGKPIDIYSLAMFMIVIAVSAVVLSAQLYNLRRSISLFILGSTIFLLILSAIVANALISLQ